MRCPISGAGLRGAGVAPAPCPPALWELRRRQPLLFPGMAELRPGETRVAAGSVVAPRWPAAPGGHRRVGSGLGRAGEGAQGWGRFGLPGGELAEELVGPLGRLSFGKTLAVPLLVPVDPAAAFSRAADLRPPGAPAAPEQQGPPLLPDRAPSPMEQAGALAPFPAPEGACQARPAGTGWEIEAGRGRSPARNRFVGWGWDGRPLPNPTSPSPAVASAMSPRKPVSNPSPARDVDLAW